MTTETAVPPGYWSDASGRLTPESVIKPVDRERDRLVREIVTHARALNAALARFKTRVFDDVSAFVSLSAEQYGVTIGGEKGNVTLSTFDGRFRVVRQVAESLVFDERLQAAKVLIDNCLRRWNEGGDVRICALVNDAFQVGTQGRIDTKRVLGLRRIAIDDEEWLQAMKAIAESCTTASSSTYVRVYERVGNTDKYEAISLDLASI